MATPLKNYTTEVPAATSIGRIEDLLVRAGALNINKTYANGRVEALSFILQIGDEQIPFRLPAKIDKVALWLRKRSPKAKEETIQTQAARITWKQLQEWVHLQLSMVEIDQLEKMEVFMPFLLDIAKNMTLFEKTKGHQFQALLQ